MDPLVWEHTEDGSPKLVSLVTDTHAVVVCGECGVVWWSVSAEAYEVPDVVGVHADRHQSGELS